MIEGPSGACVLSNSEPSAATVVGDLNGFSGAEGAIGSRDGESVVAGNETGGAGVIGDGSNGYGSGWRCGVDGDDLRGCVANIFSGINDADLIGDISI